MANIKSNFKTTLKSSYDHASSSTVPAAQILSDASLNPSHEVLQQEQPPILPEQEQAPIPLQHEQAPLPPQLEQALVPLQQQAPILLQQEQVPILPPISVLECVYSKHWIVEVRDSTDAIKQMHIKVNEVTSLTVGERIIVEFDNYGAAFGEAQGLLAGYCGSLAINCNLFPISFERWSDMPKKYMKHCFGRILKPRFLFLANESIAYRYCNASISKKWATHRQRLWNEYFDPAKSKNEILSNRPFGINADQWASFVAYRLKPSAIQLCRRNREIQRKQNMSHPGGCKGSSVDNNGSHQSNA